MKVVSNMIAFVHRQHLVNPGTFAIDLPTKSDLHSLFFTHSTQLLMNIGVSQLSEKDQFNKKVGRELASKRMTSVVVRFLGVHTAGTKHVYQFNCKLPSPKKRDKQLIELKLSLATVAEADKVHILELL